MTTNEGSFHRLFVIGMIVKGIDGIIECIGGIAILSIPRSAMFSIATYFTRWEISEDPRDRITNAILNVVHQLPLKVKIFFGVYLLVHGGVKLFLVGNLLRERLWAFPVSLVILLALFFYQNYRLLIHFSWPLAIITAIDAVVLVFIAVEYRYRKARAFPETNV